MIKAFLFDMDGVIVDSMTWHAMSWKRVFAERGIELDNQDIFRREGMSGPASIADIFMEKKLEVPSGDILEDMMRRKHGYFEEYHISIYPVAGDILRYLAGNGIRMALVTGSGRRAVIHSVPSDLLAIFQAVVTSDDVKNGKPDPEPYLTALKQLDMTRQETLVVENAPLGLRSARAAGLRCLAVQTTLSQPYLAEADRIFSNHEALLDYLCRMKEAGWKLL